MERWSESGDGRAGQVRGGYLDCVAVIVGDEIRQ